MVGTSDMTGWVPWAVARGVGAPVKGPRTGTLSESADALLTEPVAVAPARRPSRRPRACKKISLRGERYGKGA